MANPEHIEILTRGVDGWNSWRDAHSRIRPDLTDASLANSDLGRANFVEADLQRADLSGVDLTGAVLRRADLRDTNLRGARLVGTILSGANLLRADLRDGRCYRAAFVEVVLRYADLRGAHLSSANISASFLDGANLGGADLRRANLQGAFFINTQCNNANFRDANLQYATLVETDFSDADLSNCKVYGVSAWKLNLMRATQTNLKITSRLEPTITVDYLEVAQFIYLILNNEKIRDVLNTITTKVVLILGRFTPARKVVLDGLREALRSRNYAPVLFDFDKPASRSITETVRTLAHLARFVIADLTEPSSIPQELQSFVPDVAVPVQPILESGKHSYSMFEDLPKTYSWVLPTHRYLDIADLLMSLDSQIIGPAEAKAIEIERR